MLSIVTKTNGLGWSWLA